MKKELSIANAPLTKTEQEEFANSYIQKIVNGDVNPIEGVVVLKALKESIDKVLKDGGVIDALVTEFDKYGKGEMPSYGGAKVTIKEAGIKYDYTPCNDTILKDLNEKIERLTAEKKNREGYLRSRAGQVDELTGLIFNAPIKTSSTTFSVTFKK